MLRPGRRKVRDAGAKREGEHDGVQGQGEKSERGRGREERTVRETQAEKRAKSEELRPRENRSLRHSKARAGRSE